MKRLKIILALVFAVLLIALLFSLISPKSTTDEPRYLPLTNPPAISSTFQMYSWGDPVPFQDGRFWVTLVTPNATNRQINSYLYDLQQRHVVAQMQNGSAIFFNADHTRLLCSGSGPSTLADSARAIATRITGGRLNLTNNLYREHFWILDLRSNSAVHIGSFDQFKSSGSRWIPAPGFRFAYNRPSTSAWGQEFYLCDLDQQLLKKVRFNGQLLGWWNDHQILARDASASFVAYDVQTGQTSNVFTVQTISQFLAKTVPANSPTAFNATPEWNGRDYDWYFSGDQKNGLATNSTFLLKAERSGPSLKLLLRDFQFRWLGHFDDSGTHYIYQGEPGARGSGGDGSVLLLDLTNNVTRTIVPPWTSNQYLLVRQSGDTIIYSSNRILWRVDLNTTKAELLFPLPPQK